MRFAPSGLADRDPRMRVTPGVRNRVTSPGLLLPSKSGLVLMSAEEVRGH